MAFEKITDTDLVNKGISGLPDVPGLTTAAMQAKFDELSKDVIIPKLNAIVEGLNGTEVGNSSKVTDPTENKEKNIQNTIDAIYAIVADNAEAKHTHNNKTDLDTITSTFLNAVSSLIQMLSGISSVGTSITDDDTIIPTAGAIVDYAIKIGAGDMIKAVYDNDNDGVVDNASKLGGEEASRYLKVAGLPDAAVEFSEASTRENIKTGEDVKTVLGKVAKWFSDMTAAAFAQTITSYTDLMETTVAGCLVDALAVKNQFDVVTSNLNSEISRAKEADEILKSRVDNITSLPEGSTIGDAELQDIRVKADGTTAKSAGNAVREQISELKEDLDLYTKDLRGVETISGNNNIYAYNSILPLTNERRVGGIPTASENSKLQKIEINANNDGKVTVEIILSNNTLIDTFEVNVKSGIHTYYNGKDFNTTRETYPINAYCGFSPDKSSAQIKYGSDSDGSYNVTNASFLESKLSYGIGIKFHFSDMKSDYNNLKNDVLSMDGKLKKVENVVLKKLCGEIPINKPSYCDSFVLITKFVLNDSNSRIELISNIENGITGGLIGYIDFNTKELALAYGESKTVVARKENALNGISGHEYELKMERMNGGAYVSITITDIFSMQTATISKEYDLNLMLNGKGYRFVQFIGDVIIKYTKLYAPKYKCKCLIVGDSFIEGNSIVMNKNDRYAMLVKNALNGDAFIDGLGGSDSSNLLSRFNDYLKDNIITDYVIIAIGTNDTNYDIWYENINSIIDIIENKMNAIPILCTITRRNDYDNSVFISNANAQIRKYLNKNYIDVNRITTANFDGINQNTSMFLSDAVHPTVDTHRIIFERIKADVPFMFN